MKIQAMLGYKLFKELEDGTIDLIRIIKIKKVSIGDPKEVTIQEEGSKNIKVIKVEDLKGYTPLEPDGLMTFNVVEIVSNTDKKKYKDVIVTASKFLNIKVGDTLPYAICRQNITDIFYNLLCTDETNTMVGLSVNQETCPSNFNFELMLACSSIEFTQSINFYRLDTINDILKMVQILRFNTVLEQLYRKHIEYIQMPNLLMKTNHQGWAKDLTTLLHQNNFQEDINQMLGITDINPIVSEHTVTKSLPNGETYTSLDDEMILWLSSIYKVAIQDITILEYNHDINLGEFNNARYFLIRDKKDLLYLAVYTIEGEYHQSDLEARAEKKDFSDEFRINFYNKYNKVK